MKQLDGGSGSAAPPPDHAGADINVAAKEDNTPESFVTTVLLGLFVASGCAALIYEVVWFHLLRLVIGASALSLGILLASFMGGMFLGSFFFARVVPPKWHPLRVYGALEIGIGIFGLLLPLLLPAARAVYFAVFGYGMLGILVRAVVAGVLILPPTALMGATLPAVARRFAQTRVGMSGLASLYGANTAGAVIGCLLTGFYILPNWDVLVATGVAAALNFAIGASAIWLVPRSRYLAEEPSGATAATVASSSPNAVYIVIAISGTTALGAQVVWTRLLALLFGGTTYTFAIILAVYLGGLGIGSALAAAALRRGEDSRTLLAQSQLLLIPALTYSGSMIAKVIPYTSTLRITPINVLHLLHVIHCIEVILPTTILWGMSFPLALAAAGLGHRDTARSSGHVYAANTVGAIVGALGASFAGIPLWGTRVTQQVLIVCAGAAAAIMYAALNSKGDQVPARTEKGFSPTAWAAAALPLALFAATIVPALPNTFQANGRYIWLVNDQDKFPYVEEGASSTVAVRIGPGGYRYYHVGGKVEASTNASDMRLQRLLGHLSALAHPHPESILVVGLGAGVTAGSFVVHPEVKRIVICEIEPRVVPAAARYFAEANHSVISDPRVEVIHDDARHFLATTQEKFDIITSDPIHPWVRGNSVLFSREYYAIVKARLKPGGIATQWVPLYETSEQAIKIQMRTFMDAFPEGTVWNSQENAKGYDVVLLGQVEPIRLDVASIQKRIDDNADLKKSLADVRLGSAVDILSSYATSGPDLKGWLRDTPVNRDFSLTLEYISGLALNLQIADEIYASMVRSHTYPEGIFIAPPDMEAELRERIMPRGAPSLPRNK